MASSSSFYVDGETYGTATVVSNDVPPSGTPSQAPSSFFPGGNVYDALANSDTVVATMTGLQTATASSASAAAASASAAAAALAAMTPSNATPLVDGTAAAGTSTLLSRGDHVHPTDTSRAPTASPTFTGTATLANLTASGTSKLNGNVGIGPSGNVNALVDIESANAVYSMALGAPNSFVRIADGSAANPVTTNSPSVSISRREALTVDNSGGQSAALYVENLGNESSTAVLGIQPVALTAYAQQLGAGDAVGIYAHSNQSGPSSSTSWAAFGVNAQAGALVSGKSANAVAAAVQNGTGVDQNYSTNFGRSVPNTMGVLVNGIGANLQSVGVGVGVGTGNSTQFDVGVGFQGTKSADARTDSNAVTVFDARGSHTNGFDASNGTYSGSPFISTGFNVDGTGNLSAKAVIHTSSILLGSTSGQTTLNASAVAGVTALVLPAANDTLVGRATTDTLTNKTLTSPTLVTPVLGTPASGVATNLTGTAAGLTAGNVTTNAAMTGEATSSGTTNAVTLTNSAVIGKALTGYTSGAGTISASDSILGAIQKLNGNDGLKAPLASPAFTGTATIVNATVSGALAVTSSATTNVALDVSGQTAFSVTNGSSQNLVGLNGGLFLVLDVSNNLTALYHGFGTNLVMASGDPSGQFVAPTTAPAAGKASFAWSGTTLAVYNNVGATHSFRVLSLKIA